MINSLLKLFILAKPEEQKKHCEKQNKLDSKYLKKIML